MAGLAGGRPQLTDARFRNVSIITAYNSQKDKINKMGTVCFSTNNRVQLHDFYSIDLLNVKKVISSRKKKGKGSRPRRKMHELDAMVQNQLWNAPPSSTSDHVAGKLMLCKGLPIMIRNNDATKLCITKGQEGICIGWDAIVGLHGKQVLDTLYMELKNPSKLIQFQGLPLNIVPIPRTSTDMRCRLPDDTEVTVRREQVVVLPNFAMTDYSSQGKTRPDNIVDPGHSKNHQSYYTALSRSASAAGTVLVQSFDEKKITGGVSGHLQQEFRELEILNTITKKAYENCLSNIMRGSLRNVIIRMYRGSSEYHSECDCSWHPAIQWKPGEDQMKKGVEDGFWSEKINATLTTSNALKNIDEGKIKSIKQNVTTDENNYTVSDCMKRKWKECTTPHSSSNQYNDLENEIAMNAFMSGKYTKEESPAEPQSKKFKGPEDSSTDSGPLGLRWDNRDYSCGYDSLFVIIYNVWKSNVAQLSHKLPRCSSWMSKLCEEFAKMDEGTQTFEEAQDHIQIFLHRKYRTTFPMGQNGISVHLLVVKLMGRTAFGHILSVCAFCGSVESTVLKGKHLLESDGTDSNDVASMMGRKNAQKMSCSTCMSTCLTTRMVVLDEIPPLLALETDGKPSIQFCLTHDSGDITYRLRGLIYLGEFHFISRIVDLSGQVWFHNGMTTRSSCQRETVLDLSSDTDWMRKYHSKKLCYCIYTLSNE